MTRSAGVLWLVLLMNTAMILGVVAYGVGNIPFQSYGEALKCFGVGAFLAAIALAFARLSGTDTKGEASSLEDTTPQNVRLILGVIGFGVMAVGAFTMGVVSIALLLRS